MRQKVLISAALLHDPKIVVLDEPEFGAVSAPAGLLYAVAGAVDPSIGAGPDILAGHIAASTAAGFFAFAVVALLRGMLVLAIGSTAAARAALLVQVTVVVLLAGTFLFLPGLLPTLVSVLTSLGSSAPPWSVPCMSPE